MAERDVSAPHSAKAVDRLTLQVGQARMEVDPSSYSVSPGHCSVSCTCTCLADD